MAAQPIELYVPVPLAPAAAREALLRLVREFGDATSSQRRALSVNLQDLHIGVPGEISVPVAMEIAEHPARFESAISIHASADKDYFPTFEGTLSINPVAEKSELWLQGTYEPPLGVVGALLDRTVLHDTARHSLHAFLERIAEDITRDEREREERHARDIRNMHQ